MDYIYVYLSSLDKFVPKTMTVFVVIVLLKNRQYLLIGNDTT